MPRLSNGLGALPWQRGVTGALGIVIRSGTMHRIRKMLLVWLVVLVPAAVRPAEHPLSADDVTLLLIGTRAAD